MQFRNHQLYLAERSEWLDRHVVKTSLRALMKIKALTTCEYDDIKAVQKLIQSSLLDPIEGKSVLEKEGWFASNMNN
jgi:hypothetical protein